MLLAIKKKRKEKMEKDRLRKIVVERVKHSLVILVFSWPFNQISKAQRHSSLKIEGKSTYEAIDLEIKGMKNKKYMV